MSREELSEHEEEILKELRIPLKEFKKLKISKNEDLRSCALTVARRHIAPEKMKQFFEEAGTLINKPQIETLGYGITLEVVKKSKILKRDSCDIPPLLAAIKVFMEKEPTQKQIEQFFTEIDTLETSNQIMALGCGISLKTAQESKSLKEKDSKLAGCLHIIFERYSSTDDKNLFSAEADKLINELEALGMEHHSLEGMEALRVGIPLEGILFSIQKGLSLPVLTCGREGEISQLISPEESKIMKGLQGKDMPTLENIIKEQEESLKKQEEDLEKRRATYAKLEEQREAQKEQRKATWRRMEELNEELEEDHRKQREASRKQEERQEEARKEREATYRQQKAHEKEQIASERKQFLGQYIERKGNCCCVPRTSMGKATEKFTSLTKDQLRIKAYAGVSRDDLGKLNELDSQKLKAIADLFDLAEKGSKDWFKKINKKLKTEEIQAICNKAREQASPVEFLKTTFNKGDNAFEEDIRKFSRETTGLMRR